MRTVTQRENEPRPAYMLRVAAEYIREHCPSDIIIFDEVECDGQCVADDCESAICEIREIE